MAASVGLIAQIIEEKAPRTWAENWDNCGLLVGSFAQPVHKALLTLDVTPDVVEEAAEQGVQLIVAHHPLLFKPLKNLRSDNRSALLPLTLFQRGISYYAAHTNLDQSELSSGWTLARAIGLVHPEILAPAAEKIYKLVIFVPRDDAEGLRQVLAKAGAGKGFASGEHGDCYEECFFQVDGQGMFRPTAGAEPALGEIGKLNRVPEVRLECIVMEKYLSRTLKAMLQAHPYEEPAYDLIALENKGRRHGYGVIGEVAVRGTLSDFWQNFCRELPGLFHQNYDLSAVRLTGDKNRTVRKVAIANGSAGALLAPALAQGADVFVTGDLGYHDILEALEAGMAVIELGHFLSEIPMIQNLKAYLEGRQELAGLEWVLSQKNRGVWAKM